MFFRTIFRCGFPEVSSQFAKIFRDRLAVVPLAQKRLLGASMYHFMINPVRRLGNHLFRILQLNTYKMNAHA